MLEIFLLIIGEDINYIKLAKGVTKQQKQLTFFNFDVSLQFVNKQIKQLLREC